ncbi:M12 family metallo-peptidase [Engelhardtia mirabilis]|uniref:Uncharacterized protein n=1 Tax=Engelhardtia mirabilis TaxID=2528011 RepID=A0A518BDT6_9BACT|nr:hypothetical protein Pla133_01900 [Planctomycetes bacterium Pla133]QDU99452.1 hypothetical protein Pla86_01900 [Planctomycetes bacterium Pla86]
MKHSILSLTVVALAAAAAHAQVSRPQASDEQGVDGAPPALTAIEPAELLRADPLAAELAPPFLEDALRLRRVRLQPETVRRLSASAEGGFEAGALTVEFFPGEAWRLVPERWVRTGDRAFTASGSVEGRRLARWSMASRGGVVLVNLRPGDGTLLSLRTGPDGLPLATQTRPLPGHRCGNELGLPSAPHLVRQWGPPAGAAGGDDGGPLVPKANTILQLLVVMTPSAVAQLGGGLAARTAVELAVEEGNDVFANSAVSAQWQLEAACQVPYNEGSNTHSTHLSRLTNSNDGFMDDVHEWRGVLHADFVALIVNDTDTVPAPGGGTTSTLGLAWVQPPAPTPWNGPFCTIDQSAMVGNLTLPHELGHNMGINHDLASNPGTVPITEDAYGWLFTGNTQGNLRTVMGTGNATRIPFYSNPLVKFDGQATGQPSALFQTGADAASALNGNLFLYSQMGFSTLPTDLGGSFCNFSAGPIQMGLFNTPFDKLLESVLQVGAPGGGVYVGHGGNTTETPLLWFERRIEVDSNDPAPFTVGG